MVLKISQVTYHVHSSSSLSLSFLSLNSFGFSHHSLYIWTSLPDIGCWWWGYHIPEMWTRPGEEMLFPAICVWFVEYLRECVAASPGDSFSENWTNCSNKESIPPPWSPYLWSSNLSLYQNQLDGNRVIGLVSPKFLIHRSKLSSENLHP